MFTARGLVRSRLLQQYASPLRNLRLQSNQHSPHVAQSSSRISRIESRLPRFFRRYIDPLRNAPISHISAFLILHELTAVIPLFGLAGIFHYYNWLPPYISEGKWVSEGIEKFGLWLRKRGWIQDDSRHGRWWGRGETGARIVVELATAYAITKALLPVRLVFSVWATPWFATWTVLPVTKRLSRLFTRRKQTPALSEAGAGTGALSGGVVTKAPK